VTATPGSALPLAPSWIELAKQRQALFLDIDGTLLEFETHPDLVRATQGLISLLRSVSDVLDGALAVISGRSLADIDRIFKPWQPYAAGVHGAEVRGPDGTRIHQPDDATLSRVRAEVAAIAEAHPGVWVEDKGISLAIHFRDAPDAAAGLATDVRRVADESAGAFDVQPGVFVYELRPAAIDKGLAVTDLMSQPPFLGRSPLVVGDDRTDEFAFAAALRLSGTAIVVGERSDTLAPLRLPHPAAGRAWLTELIEEVRA
jgi:trehalose 6-phosphate phosphatase